MRLCPFCKEEIKDDAIKCPHCRSFLGGRPEGGGSRPGPDQGVLNNLQSQAQTAMILGILAFVICQILAPFAYFKGKEVNAQLRAIGEPENGMASAGYWLGLVGSIILILGLVGFLLFILSGILGAAFGA